MIVTFSMSWLGTRVELRGDVTGHLENSALVY